MEKIKQMIDEAIKDHETRLHKKSRVIANKPASIKELDDYCIEKGIDVLPQYIWDFFESKGWKVGKVPMKNWRAAVSRARYWEEAPRRKLPAKVDPEAEAAALEKRKQEIRDDEGLYFRELPSRTLHFMLKGNIQITRHWLIKEVLQERTKQ